MAQRPAGPPPVQTLPIDELYVICQWSVQALADELLISEEAAKDLLEAAYNQRRVQVLGTSMFAGVMVDDRWIVVESRERIREATREWQALRAMERQFEPDPE
jgi:hypothetical protein